MRWKGRRVSSNVEIAVAAVGQKQVESVFWA